MPGSHSTLCIDSFYPETELKITKIQQDKEQILIRMKSISKKWVFPQLSREFQVLCKLKN